MIVTKEVRKPYSLRIPDDLKSWLKTRATKNLRSMNAEITSLLQDLKDKPTKQEAK